jgi:hypothetical protein
MTVPEHLIGLQVTANSAQRGQQHTQEQINQLERRPTEPSSLGEFIVEDFKLFASPVKVVVDEFLRQLKR